MVIDLQFQWGQFSPSSSNDGIENGWKNKADHGLTLFVIPEGNLFFVRRTTVYTIRAV